MINIYAKTCANCMQILYTTIVVDITLGSTYNEFGYNEQPVTMNSVFFQKRTLLIDINVRSITIVLVEPWSTVIVT